MTFHRRSTPARLIPVQLNVRVPFAYRAFLKKEALRRNTSLNKLIADALCEAHPHPSILEVQEGRWEDDDPDRGD